MSITEGILCSKSHGYTVELTGSGQDDVVKWSSRRRSATTISFL